MKLGSCFVIALFGCSITFAQENRGEAANLPILRGFESTQGMVGTFQRTPAPVFTVVEDSADPGGVLRLSGIAGEGDGSHYLGVMIPLAEPVNLAGKRLVFQVRSGDPATTAAFYVRAYNVGSKKPAWSFSSWSGTLGKDWFEVSLQKENGGSFGWEPQVVDGADADLVDRIELVIGNRVAGDPLSLEVGALRWGPRIPHLAEITVAPSSTKVVSLLKNGKAQARILHPDSVEGRTAATAIAALIERKTGVALPVMVASKEGARFTDDVILIGNAMTNPAIGLLYARHLTPVDLICPGPGEKFLHTVNDPYRNGHAAVVVGASDPAGLELVNAAFLHLLEGLPYEKGTLEVPRTHQASFDRNLMRRFPATAKPPADSLLADGLKEAQKILDTGRHQSLAGQLNSIAVNYLLTGYPRYASLYVALWDLYAEQAVEDAASYGGPWGFDSDFSSYRVVSGWDVIRHDPILTEEQRVRTTQHLCRWIAEAVAPKASFREGRVSFNHQTFPALGVLRTGLFLKEHFPETLEEFTWLAKADGLFRNQAQFYKVDEDCNTYQWLTNGHLLRYALARPDHTVFDNGNARKIADYALATMNNLGYQVPYGDTGAWTGSFSENQVLGPISSVLDYPPARWASLRKTELRSAFAVESYQATGAPGPPPTDYDGLRVWPLELAYARTFPEGGLPPEEQRFDKITLRKTFSPEAPYLLLDGLGNGGHGHHDANSVLQFTQFDRIWLADNDYYRSQVKYHNSMQILRDGESSPVPDYAALLGRAESERFGYSHTRMVNYSDCDWDRTLIWWKEKDAFAILDRVTPRTEADFHFRLFWHGIGEATLQNNDLLLLQKGPSLRIQVAPGPEGVLAPDSALGARNWAGYPHAAPVVQTTSFTERGRRRAGEAYLFATIIHGDVNEVAKPGQIAVLDKQGGAEVRIDDDVLQIQTGEKGLALRLGEEAWTVKDSGSVEASEFETATPASVPALTVAAVPNRGGERDKGTPFQRIWQVGLLTGDDAKTAASPTAMARFPGSDAGVVVGSGNGSVVSLDSNGKELWRYALGSAVRDLAGGEIGADKKAVVVIGGNDGALHVVGRDGKLLWKKELSFYRREPHVNLVRIADLDGDGSGVVVAGGNNWKFFVWDSTGKERWNYETVHPSRSAAIADLDGDGTREIVAGTEYTWASILEHDGKLRSKVRFQSPICHSIDTGLFRKEKGVGILFGAGDGHLYQADSHGEVVFRFDTGDEVTEVRGIDLDGNGTDEMVAASGNGYLYAFTGEGKPLWRRPVAGAISDLASITVDGVTALAAATDVGELIAYDAAGAVLRSSPTGVAVVALLSGSDGIFLIADDGSVSFWRPR
jgi:hypothetical protein